MILEENTMKTKRRALALVLAIVMVFSLSIAAFARDGGTITSATINGETATVTTIDGVNYVRATLNGTTNYTASEYSLRTATITFAASEEATSDDVDLTENDDGTYTASADLFNKCADVFVGDTLYRFAAGLKSGDVTIDANDPWKVDFTIGGESFTNNAYNVQNPDIGTSTEPDGWTGIAYTVRGTLPSTANLSALSMTVVKRNAAATISGTAVTANSDGTYTLSLSGTDKMIKVTYAGETRNYYVAATVAGSSKVNVSFTIDATNAKTKYPTQYADINTKMKAATEDKTGVIQLELDSGATVYDALVAVGTKAGITIGAQNSSYGVYVYAIGGIAAGGSAGWMYSVNGEVPMVGAASYVLTNNDVVRWFCVGY